MINIVLKEDDIIKWKRIESILQSMDFNYKQVKVEKNQMLKDVETIKKILADMGETEILAPLQALSKISPRKKI